jgi:hypothetical protein
MKIGQRDVWIGIGKGEKTLKKWWVVFTPLAREWIPPMCPGVEGFWLSDVPRRFEIHGPKRSFALALTPGSRWGKGSKEEFLNGTAKLMWIEWTPKREVAEIPADTAPDTIERPED